ncbi:sodium/proline symporter [Paramaledivibacter caminithermalis]|jgi:SSS family transporter|uniref:Sodium/proline symporter n=1 Tax=Paramaledivibacter caminithermalis (strain DSM 15212 / CIP 107654 / DViRD3) TaxID=1121301 RepID=A0A1M6TG86_PARC5|nr:sodium/proline symporter [Paramaledivibacter caminithermalis]SHK56052.1 sodium/pantothenate symporter [Paramaledivibacter caminithermalis DSM 15212]
MNIVILVIILYMLIVLGIGFWAMKKTKSSEDFFVAGKQLGIMAVAMAAFSAAISGFVFVGGPGLAYKLGVGTLWLTFPTSISFAMAWIILGKRMRLLAETRGCMTVSDAIYARFESKNASFLAALASLVGLVLYLATQISAFAFILSPIFGWSFKTAVIVGMGIVLLYSVAGGMLAGVYTDVFQGSVMAVASLFVFGYALSNGGGMANMTKVLAQQVKPEFVGPWGVLPASLAMGWFFCLAIGIVGQPHIAHKFYMIKDIRKLKWGPVIAAVAGMLGGLLWLSVGLVVRYKVAIGEIAALENSDLAISVFLDNYAPKILAGIIYAGIASAVMSTADSFINLASAAIVRDIPKAFDKKFTSEQELKYGRLSVVILSILTVIISFVFGKSGVAILGAFGWGTFAAALAPTLGIGLNWKRATKQAAFWSIFIGLGLNLVLEIGSKMGANWYAVIFKPLGIYNGTFSLVISIIVFIGVSYLTPESKLKEDIEAIMNA